MKKETLSKWLPYIVAILVFIVLSMVFAAPEVFDNKVLQAGDQVSAKGMYQECKEYNEQGHYSFWTGSMFCGMPNYQIGGGKYPAPAIDIPLSKVLRLGFTGTMALVIGYFLGFFILMRSFKIEKWLAIIAAIAAALSTYFIIIIAAGHNAKVVALAFLPPLIAGFYYIFQKRYILGAIITLLYTSAGIMQHPQMTYYVGLTMGIMLIAEIYIHIKEKRWKDFFVSSAIFLAAFIIGFGTQITPFMANQEYVKETMRGGHSELTKTDDSTNKTEGLDLDYATAWSYGIDETMTLLIPGFKGYSSNHDVGINSKVYQTLMNNGVQKKNAVDFCQNVPTYWGDQPFTAGPVYVGAIVCFLFILGILIVQSPYKWALLAATLFSILLSWGNHFMSLTEFFFSYFPMYNKFRAVSSILIVAEITMPLLGFLAIKEISEKKMDKKKVIKSIYISAGITAGLCLIFGLLGKSLFNFTSPNDESIFAQLPVWLQDGILQERASMLVVSAWRSFFFILLGAGLLWLWVNEKVKYSHFVAILGVLILMDMLPVNKHFLNENNFVSEKQSKSYFKKMPYEEDLLKDPTLSYRVFNLTTNTFNESRTSYYFKSIGGYSAAKLRRYQDLIDQHISKLHWPVINMLNTKYIIINGNDNQPHPQINPDAMGNAWFVDSVFIAQNPDEECAALNTLNLKNSLVTDVKFEQFVKGFTPHHDSTATIQLTAYAPDYVEYDASLTQDGIAVFSEIYYPYGWNAYIDNQPVEHFRVNYTLRALNIAAGKHHIRFEFKPQTIEKYGKIAIACKYVMWLFVFAMLTLTIIKWRRNQKTLQPATNQNKKH